MRASSGDKAEVRHYGRVWTEEARANANALRARLRAIRARGCPAGSKTEFEAVCDGIEELISHAVAAIEGRSPEHRRFVSWWNGTCVEAAFKHLHKAEAEMARLYNPNEVCAEVPEAVARAEWALSRDDPRRAAALYLLQWMHAQENYNRAQLSKIIQLGHEAADRQRTKLRTFRNIVLLGGLVGMLIGATLIFVVSMNPSAVPFCFTPQPRAFVCPTGGAAPSGGDIGAVALMGLLGGLISGAVFIHTLKANSTPYNITVPLAILKIPAGALTAIAALLILAGDFVPGFSAIDSQAQILAYALAFGFAQQLLTRLLDQRAQSLAASIPSKGVAQDQTVAGWPDRRSPLALPKVEPRSDDRSNEGNGSHPFSGSGDRSLSKPS